MLILTWTSCALHAIRKQLRTLAPFDKFTHFHHLKKNENPHSALLWIRLEFNVLIKPLWPSILYNYHHRNTWSHPSTHAQSNLGFVIWCRLQKNKKSYRLKISQNSIRVTFVVLSSKKEREGESHPPFVYSFSVTAQIGNVRCSFVKWIRCLGEVAARM